MTVLEDVINLLNKIKPHAICDDCITAQLGLSVRQHANHKTRLLANKQHYNRQKGLCNFCTETKLIIRDI